MFVTAEYCVRAGGGLARKSVNEAMAIQKKKCLGSRALLEQHLTVICGLALRQFPRYKSKRHGLTHKDEDKRKWIEYK